MELDEIESHDEALLPCRVAFSTGFFLIVPLCLDPRRHHPQRDTRADSAKEITETWIILGPDLGLLARQEEDAEKTAMTDMKIVDDAEMIAVIAIDAPDPADLHHPEGTEEALIEEVS